MRIIAYSYKTRMWNQFGELKEGFADLSSRLEVSGFHCISCTDQYQNESRDNSSKGAWFDARTADQAQNEYHKAFDPNGIIHNLLDEDGRLVKPLFLVEPGDYWYQKTTPFYIGQNLIYGYPHDQGFFSSQFRLPSIACVTCCKVIQEEPYEDDPNADPSL